MRKFVLEPWYYDFTEPRCPHDAQFCLMTFKEGDLTVRYDHYKHDQSFAYIYHDVKSLNFETLKSDNPDVFYFDEFLVSDEGLITHEVQGLNGWKLLIKAADIELRFT